MPYVGTTLRIFPAITAVQRRLLAAESSMSGKPIVFDVHPNEFIDETNEKREFERRSSNPVSSFLQDTVRSKLKVKNLGIGGAKLYEREICFFEKKKFEFMTIKEYSKTLDL